jgi:hypothetical protein
VNEFRLSCETPVELFNAKPDVKPFDPPSPGR